MLSKIFRKGAVALTLAAIGAGSALAVVTIDFATGMGFVGKGDVQQIFGWNNKALQDNAASVSFRVSAVEVKETTWTCQKDGAENTQMRTRSTTTSTQGVVSSIARDRNQITGFNISGYSGAPTISSVNDGPALGSCPTNWSVVGGYTEEPISNDGGLQVSTDGTNWYNLN